MTTRRAFLGTLAGSVLAAPLAAEAQQAGKVYRLGVLNVVRGRSHITKALEEGLRELGYAEGRNLNIEWSLGDRLADRLADRAAAMVRLRPDVIVAISIQAAVAAKRATSAIPIVMLIIGDAIAEGLVDSLARPSGNVTGVATEVTPELSSKQLEFLTEVAPKSRRVAVLLNPDWGPNAARWTKAQEASPSLRLSLVRVEVRHAAEVETAFATMRREKTDALFVFGDPVLYVLHHQIADLAIRSRLPNVWQYREATNEGGLISYGPNFAAAARRIATYVDKILRGAKPGDLPIEQPTKFELVINMKTAKALGLTIPSSLLGRADEIIQ